MANNSHYFILENKQSKLPTCEDVMKLCQIQTSLQADSLEGMQQLIITEYGTQYNNLLTVTSNVFPLKQMTQVLKCFILLSTSAFKSLLATHAQFIFQSRTQTLSSSIVECSNIV